MPGQAGRTTEYEEPMPDLLGVELNDRAKYRLLRDLADHLVTDHNATRKPVALLPAGSVEGGE